MSDRYAVSAELTVGGERYRYLDLAASAADFNLARLPFALKILLENLLRHEGTAAVSSEDIVALLNWQATAEPVAQIAFTPARVVLQDFTGVPAVVDLAAMRAAMQVLGGDPARINPLCPVDLVIDHSVMVDHFGSVDALARNTAREFERNGERYQFLRWGQQAFANFRVVPPGTGIVHQVNLEYLAGVVLTVERNGEQWAIPDTLVGTDSHTTMINGLGVLGWGVGGIEAEAAMLGQAITMLLPQVVGVRLHGQLREGTTATDLVLTVTELLRSEGVVGKFVEFFGDGLDHLPLADRATIANMAPEYGATCGIFPIDAETLRYLELSGRDARTIALVEAYARAQTLWREPGAPVAEYSKVLDLDLATVEPSLAGPKRPQDRIALSAASTKFSALLATEQAQREQRLASDRSGDFAAEGGQGGDARQQLAAVGVVDVDVDDKPFQLRHGSVVIAAITSCTNTSNPAVLVAAGLVAQRARARGLQVPPWVKTSFAPGSQVVPAYLEAMGLMAPLVELGFDIVGYGCTTCIGNSGPLPEAISRAIRDGELLVASVLSGNRNFEGRIHPDVPANYLASPPLVVAYALAGTMQCDLLTEPLGQDRDGQPVFLKDLWPTQAEIQQLIATHVSARVFRERYADVFSGTDAWRALPVPQDAIYAWSDSTYVRQPPYFADMPAEPVAFEPIEAARTLVMVGDSITTDHISPAGAIKADSPAGDWLQQHGVQPADFNSYGSRRGNHEVMVRGTFANVRLQNMLAPGTRGGQTLHFPSGDPMTIFAAAERYREEGVALIVLAGKEYGTGSSRDWAAKGVNLLGVRAVLAESFERIHRSNLVGFGVLPLEFAPGESASALGLDGTERFSVGTPEEGEAWLSVVAVHDSGHETTFRSRVRIDTDVEWAYFRHGGILHYVLRQLRNTA